MVGGPWKIPAPRVAVTVQLPLDRRRMPTQLSGDTTHREAESEQVSDLHPFLDVEVATRHHHHPGWAVRLVLVFQSDVGPAASAHAEQSAGVRIRFPGPHQLPVRVDPFRSPTLRLRRHRAGGPLSEDS